MDLLDGYIEMIHEPEEEPVTLTKEFNNATESVQRIIAEQLENLIGAQAIGHTERFDPSDVVIAEEHTTIASRGITTDMIAGSGGIANTITAGTITFHSTSSLIIEPDGSIHTLDREGNPVIRISSNGISINGRMVLPVTEGSRYGW
jgi:hypothetical protein